MGRAGRPVRGGNTDGNHGPATPMDPPSSHARVPARQRISRLIQVLLLLPALSSCGLWRPPVARLTPPMPVQAPLRKQVLQGYMPFGSIGWVNNELVTFSGKRINHIQKDALYAWDVKSKPRLLLTNSPGGCISNGTIRGAQLFDEGKVRYFQLEAPKFALRPAIRSQAPLRVR